MFHQLTRYMFEQWLPQATSSTQAEEVTTAPQLTTADTDDDWVLVDTAPLTPTPTSDDDNDSNVNSRSSSMESLHLDDGRDNEPYNFPRYRDDDRDDGSDDDELSWFLTPPPCFISTGPIHMETSPLENLLIEHPSMSVYTVHRRHLVGVTHVDRAVVVEAEEVNGDEEESIVVVGRAPRTYQHQIFEQRERQAGEYRLKAQKVHVRDKCKSINRNSLDRTNKARELNGRNRRQRRGERSQGARRSYANNNRKC